ncbi:MAG TPA: glycosyltransferase family 39 protein [Chthoniobacterales bacterium]|nr:glycosyltransferase family 39 protein [Chthoniobacterales bacterium]
MNALAKRVAAFLHSPPRAVHAPWALLWLSLTYLVVSTALLLHVVSDPQRAAKMTEKDSRQYLQIAEAFAAGDFSMSYVQARPHRQPLYPFLLAGAVRMAGGSLVALGMVNVLVGLFALWLVYFLVGELFASPAVSFVVGFLFVTNRFIYGHVAGQLWTEPLFVFLSLLVLLFFLRYLASGRALHLAFASVACGLAYLTRPNGLLMMAALLVSAAVYDFWHRRALRAVVRLGFGYAAALLLFAVITLPASLPRAEAFGRPFYHGHVSNFLWSDDYHTARATKRLLTWRDYAATHDLGDAVLRWLYGCWEVFVRIPLAVEIWAVLYALAVAGIWLALRSADARFRYLLLFLLIQLVPLIWGIWAARSGRLPYAVMLPFLFVFAALALQNWSARAAASLGSGRAAAS